MTPSLGLQLAQFILTVLVGIALYAWRGGEWSGTERRQAHQVEIDLKEFELRCERRFDQASGEMSKLTGRLQELAILQSDVRLLTYRVSTLEGHRQAQDRSHEDEPPY